VRRSAISSTALPVIRLMMSLPAFAPYTSSKRAAISPVVSPRAVSDSTIWPMPSRRRCRLRTMAGSNVPSRPRGTSISTGPISLSAVLARVPLRELPPLRPAGSCLS